MSEVSGKKRAFLRFIVIVSLLGILVAISVIKSNVSARREELNLKSLTLKYQATIDSLQNISQPDDSSAEHNLMLQTQLNLLLLNQLQDSTRFYADSIRKIEEYYQAIIDSANRKKGAAGKGSALSSDKGLNLSGTDMVKMVNEFDSLVATIPEKTPPRERVKAIDQLTNRLTKKYTNSASPSKK